MNKRRLPPQHDQSEGNQAWPAYWEAYRPYRQPPPQPARGRSNNLSPFLIIGFLILQSLALLATVVISWPVTPSPQAQVHLPTLPPTRVAIIPTPTLPLIVVPPTPIPSPAPLAAVPLLPDGGAAEPTLQPTAHPVSPPPALKLRGVEITQGIQVFNEPELPRCNPDPNHPNHIFCNNSVPLVAGRHTLVRVYPTCAETCPTTDTTVTLRLLKDGQEYTNLTRTLAAATLQRINNLALLDLRLYLDNSVNFEFFPPPDWVVGQITFVLEALPQGEIAAAPATLRLDQKFAIRKPLRVAYLPISYQGQYPPEIAGLDYWLLRMYPVPGVQYYRLPVPDLAWQGEVSKAEVLGKLLYTYWLYVQNQPLETWPDQLFGWLPQPAYNGGASDPFWCSNCAGAHSSRVAFGGFRPEPDIGGPRILVHEIAHNLGAQHAWTPTQREDAACFKAEGADISVDPDWPYLQTSHTQEVGIDLYSTPPAIYPPSVYDVMSYCAQPWISPYTYRRIFNSPFLQPDQAALPLTSVKPQLQASSSGALLISGVVYADGSLSQPHIIQLDGGAFAGPPGFMAPAGDDYCLEAYGHNQALLARRCFDIGFVDLETGQSTGEASPFFFTLTEVDPAQIVRLTITNNSSASSFDIQPASVTVVPSPNPPLVTVNFPNGGELLSGQATIIWQGTDPDGDPLRYDVLYSPDGGQSWLPVAVHLSESHYTLSTQQLSASQNGLIQVVASDGFHTSLDQSNAPFTIAP